MAIRTLLSQIGLNWRNARHYDIGPICIIDGRHKSNIKFCWDSTEVAGQVAYMDVTRTKKYGIDPLRINNHSLPYISKFAYRCSAGRFIRKFNRKFTDAQVAYIAEHYLSAFVSNIIVLEDVTDAYKREKTPIRSCMTGTPYVDFYKKNGVKAVATVEENGQILSRALLWENCEDEKGEKISFVDVVYGPPSHRNAIVEWAFKNGYYFYGLGVLQSKDGEEKKAKLRYKLPCPDCECYPYIDTMYYIDMENGYAQNFHQDECFCADSTDGVLQGYNDDYADDDYW